jgi:hypothetical protein
MAMAAPQLDYARPAGLSKQGEHSAGQSVPSVRSLS